jgi:hypothetical protein
MSNVREKLLQLCKPALIRRVLAWATMEDDPFIRWVANDTRLLPLIEWAATIAMLALLINAAWQS